MKHDEIEKRWEGSNWIRDQGSIHIPSQESQPFVAGEKEHKLIMPHSKTGGVSENVGTC